MTIKHLIAGAVVTAAVSAALVLGSAVGAQAQVFPTPTPIPPKSVNQPIYTVPSYPGFHLPSQLWTKVGPLPDTRHTQYPWRILPTCDSLFEPDYYTELANAGYIATTDTRPLATQDPQLLALLAAGASVSCDFVNYKTGAHIDITDAVYVNDAAVDARLDALGYTPDGPTMGRTKYFDSTSRLEIQDAANGLGGWDLISYSGTPVLIDLEPGLDSALAALNR